MKAYNSSAWHSAHSTLSAKLKVCGSRGQNFDKTLLVTLLVNGHFYDCWSANCYITVDRHKHKVNWGERPCLDGSIDNDA
jgi:hypothetical protein